MLQNVFQAIAARDAQQALALAEQAVAAQPDSHEAQHALGLAKQLAGDLAGAAAALDRAIELAPDQAGYHVTRAALALGMGDGERADVELGNAISSDPNRLSAYIFGAQLALARGQADEAEKQLKLAQRVAPEHPVVIAIEGNIASLRGDHDKAERLLAAAAQASPRDSLIIASLGLAYLRHGRHAFAEQALRRALELNTEQVQMRWALIEALGRQNRIDEVISELQQLLQRRPQDRRALTLLGDALLRTGQLDLALPVFQRLFALRPLALPAFDAVCNLLTRVGRDGEARELLEQQLALDPASDALWQRRAALAAGQSADLLAVVTRWREALPDSAIQRGVSAQVAEARGELDLAEAEADACLAAQPNLLSALQVKVRALLRRDPAAALAMAEQVAEQSRGDVGRRAAHAWRGLALDLLGRPAEASQAFRAATELADPQAQLPTLIALPAAGAAVAPAGEGATPRLLWGPPGSRVLELVGLLRRAESLHMLDDRFGAGPRGDGLWPPRRDGVIANQRGWNEQLQALGFAPERTLDWLPHWDGRLEHALPEALLIAVLSDPRDLLLNALVFGGPQPWPAPAPRAMAAWLAQALELLVERQQRAPARTVLIEAAELAEQPAAVIARVADLLGIEAAIDVSGLEQARLAPGGAPLCFAPGRWREFSAGFAEEFALLAPVARKLGYPD